MKLFIETSHCSSRAHCLACRQDRTFRLNLAQHWELPGGLVDFACPLSVPWPDGFTPTDETVVAGSPVAARSTVARPAPQPPETPEVIAERTRESWLGAAKLVAHGAAGLTKYALGIDRSPDELIADRLAICDGCEKSTPKDKPVADRYCDRSGNGAPGCGCWLKAKTALAQEHCPLSKW